MKKSCFHVSCEGGQLGFLALDQFLAEVKKAGGTGAQPSNYMLTRDGRFMPADQIKGTFARYGMVAESISCHCLNWVHGAAAYASDTGNVITKQVIPFVPAPVCKQGAVAVENWAQDQLFALMDLCAELNVKILHTFFGPYQGWEVVSGYPWGFFRGGNKKDGTEYDLVQEGLERFVRKTAPMRRKANELGIYFGHEIHRNSAAACAPDFAALVKACDCDRSVAVGADPSHCDEGEGWEERFTHPAVAPRIVIAHVKNFRRRLGVFAGRMTGVWGERSKEFATHGDGEVNLIQYAEVLAATGYHNRFCRITGRPTAPLVSEAEVARQDQLAATIDGIGWVRDYMLIIPSKVSFEDGMGAAAETEPPVDSRLAMEAEELAASMPPAAAAKDDWLIPKLVELGYVTAAAVDDWRGHTKQGLVGTLLEQKIILPVHVATARAAHFGVELIRLGQMMNLADDIIATVPSEIARRYRVIPVNRQGNQITIALADPSDLNAIDSLYHLLNAELTVCVATKEDIEAALNKYYAPVSSAAVVPGERFVGPPDSD